MWVLLTDAWLVTFIDCNLKERLCKKLYGWLKAKRKAEKKQACANAVPYLLGRGMEKGPCEL